MPLLLFAFLMSVLCCWWGSIQEYLLKSDVILKEGRDGRGAEPQSQWQTISQLNCNLFLFLQIVYNFSGKSDAPQLWCPPISNIINWAITQLSICCYNNVSLDFLLCQPWDAFCCIIHYIRSPHWCAPFFLAAIWLQFSALMVPV